MLSFLSENTLFFGKQELSFRGHDVSEVVLIMSKCFLSTVQSLIQIFEFPLHGKLVDWNQVMFYSDVQNDLIERTDSVVPDGIDNEIYKCSFLSVQVDETRDVSTKEQLSLIVGLDRNGEIVERLLKFVNVSQDRSAPAITAIVKNILSKYGESLKEKILCKHMMVQLSCLGTLGVSKLFFVKTILLHIFSLCSSPS